MCSNEDVLSKLQENNRDVFDEAIRLLVKIAENILKDPSNLKIRTLQKSNATINKKILAAVGGKDCLKYMGFKENDTLYVLPPNASLEHVRTFKDQIKTLMFEPKLHSEKASSSQQGNCSSAIIKDNLSIISNTSDDAVIKKIVLPTFVPIFSNQLLQQVEWHFHEMLAYENKDLLERAKNLIPLCTMENAAQEKLRKIQEQIKKGNLKDPDLSIQDMLILELLSWFKYDFFIWVDNPDCTFCGGKTRMSHMSKDPNLLVYTDRVEMHVCNTCQQLTPFPRYNDLNILLETRKGRCGEWAKVFTLLCKSLGWDSRFVVDQGDHVWTEVYSVTQKRWLHCDSCENACDTPLVYESGWGKKLSYVIAYSTEEVQDVTWRYSSNHKEVMKRRNSVSESELIGALMKLRENRQKTLPETRRKYLTKRLLQELAELLIEKKPNDSDKHGRTSGSSAWRLARGEIEEKNECASYVWKIKAGDVVNDTFQVSYSPSKNAYEATSGSNIITTLNGWHSGAFNHSGLFWKEEKDWKMVYLARTEGTNIGTITWKFLIENADKVIKGVSIILNHKTFENGEIDVEVSGDQSRLSFEKGQERINTDVFSGSKSLIITAKLQGGKGDVAWQHAQLFRQSLESDNFPFCVNLTFKNS